MLKMSDNPPPRPPNVSSVAELTGPWWVAHTKPRAEKLFAWDLLQMRTGYYLPMVEQTRFSGGRKRRVLQPLFPGYVFFCGDAVLRTEAKATGRLCQVISVPDQEELGGQLGAIEQALGAGYVLERRQTSLVGSHCWIRAGPLRGVEGTVLEVDRERAKVLLSVSMIGEGGVLEIEPELVERLDDLPAEEGRGGVD